MQGFKQDWEKDYRKGYREGLKKSYEKGQEKSYEKGYEKISRTDSGNNPGKGFNGFRQGPLRRRPIKSAPKELPKRVPEKSSRIQTHGRRLNHDTYL